MVQRPCCDLFHETHPKLDCMCQADLAHAAAHCLTLF